MTRLIVSAEASPLFGNFLMIVSVTSDTGVPTKGLKPDNFEVVHLASLNHAGANQRVVTKATESPAGFYILELKPNTAQPTLPPGHYVFGVAVAANTGLGQTLASGNIPK